jgi:hypothetical protein
VLDLGDCGVGDAGVVALGRALRTNNKLERLDLTDGNEDEESDEDEENNTGAEALSWNTSLRDLQLSEQKYALVRPYLQANKFMKTFQEQDRTRIEAEI